MSTEDIQRAMLQEEAKLYKKQLLLRPLAIGHHQLDVQITLSPSRVPRESLEGEKIETKPLRQSLQAQSK